MQGCSESWETAAVRRKTKLLKQKNPPNAEIIQL